MDLPCVWTLDTGFETLELTFHELKLRELTAHPRVHLHGSPAGGDVSETSTSQTITRIKLK